VTLHGTKSFRLTLLLCLGLPFAVLVSRSQAGPSTTQDRTLTSVSTDAPTSAPRQETAAAIETNANLPTAIAVPTVTPFLAITANSQWKPISQSFDGVEMVIVPPGCFRMGDDQAGDYEKPITALCLDKPFWLDKYEVTQAQFAQLGGKAARIPGFIGTNRPRETITWFEARDFCAKRGTRLPSEAEWEYAARGPDSLVYPWGNTFDPNNVVYATNANRQTADVGSRPRDAAWVGALDLSGNVEEWTSSLFQPYPYLADDGRESATNTSNARVIRGGSWFLGSAFVRVTIRHLETPENGNYALGFRCARSYDSN
jgi:formylglycine-generating enzyme required for sulfatase activity